MKTDQPSKPKRSYIPHKAAAEFKPSMDWTKEQALEEYNSGIFAQEVDKIYFEDCISGMENLQSESIDIIIADPPFGLRFNEKEALYNRDSQLVADGYLDVKIEDYTEFTYSWISKLPRIMKEDAGVWIFSGWTHLIDVLNALKDNKLTLINHIIWKYQFGVFTRRKFVTSHYHILFAVKNEKDYFFNKIEHYPEDVWHINREYNRGVKKNATKLPPDVVRRCIDFGSVPGDLILDPFIGNGTTAIVAKGSYRHYLGFEINTTLKDIISKGLEKIQVGDDYIPYCNRPDELVDKAKKKFKMK